MFLAAISSTFFAALLLAAALERFCLKHGIMPKDSYRRKSSEQVALLGGIAIFLAASPGLIYFSPSWSIPLLLSFLPMLGAGILDDLNELRGRTKLLAQVSTGVLWATLYPIKSSFFFHMLNHTYLAFPLTVIWVVALINAFNLVDGIDGQASVFGLLVAGVLTLLTPEPHGCAILVAAISGFLGRNFHPAKIYLGEVGSSFIGFSLAAMSTTIQVSNPNWSHFVALLFLFSVPMSDMLAAIIRRLQSDVSVFTGDREHIHHRLIKLQFSVPQAVLVTSVMVFCSSLTAALAFKVDTTLRWGLFAQAGSLLTLLFYGLFWLEKRMSQRLLGLSSRMIVKHLTPLQGPRIQGKKQRGLLLDLLPYFRELQGVGILTVQDFLQDLAHWIQATNPQVDVRGLGSYSLLMIYHDQKMWTADEIARHSQSLYALLHKFRVVRNEKPIPEGMSFVNFDQLESLLPLSITLGEDTTPSVRRAG